MSNNSIVPRNLNEPEDKFEMPVDAVILAGGLIKDLPASEPKVAGKGHIMIGDKPMSAYALAALRQSKKIRRIILVSPMKREDLGPEWEGLDEVVPAGSSLTESLFSGLKALPLSDDPVLLVAGDLPFLSVEAVDDFLDRCAAERHNVLWYGFLDKAVSQAKYPEVRHTWVKMVEGTFCGGGLTCLRGNIAEAIREAMDTVTAGRKNPFKLAGILGLKTLFYLLIGRLTIPMAEEAAARLLKLPCCGIVSPYAETAYNIDDAESLEQARRRLSNPSN